MPGVESGWVALARDSTARAQVEELRRAAYLRSVEFYVDDACAYRWNEDDDVSDVMVAWSETGEALATMRGATARDRTEAEERFECAVALGDDRFPALLLERGATSEARGGAGLNSLLRYHFLMGALDGGAASVVGAVFDGAPRLHLLADLGYEFHEPERTWDRSLRSRTRLVVVTLPRDRLATAVELLCQRFKELIAAYPWYGSKPRYGLGAGATQERCEPRLSPGRTIS